MKKEKEDRFRKVLTVFLIVTTILILVAGFTYAYLDYISEKENINN